MQFPKWCHRLVYSKLQVTGMALNFVALAWNDFNSTTTKERRQIYNSIVPHYFDHNNFKLSKET